MTLLPSDEKVPRLRALTRVVLWTALVFFVGSSLVAGWLVSFALKPGPQTTESTAIVFIPRGSSGKTISRLLAESKLIHDDPRFIILSKIMGKSKQLQAGEFSLHTRLKPLDVLEELVVAKPVEHYVTIPEGLRYTEIASIFADDGWAERERFIECAQDQEFIQELGLGKIPSLEGYLYPDTYSLVRPAVDEKQLITMLVQRALDVWQSLPVSQQEPDRHEVFTLASIIEKETGQDEERPLIAAVFLNRLRKKMRLQSDPTVIYGINNHQGSLSRTDLKKPTPYNTYIIPALPPGPISSPGKEALMAVLEPASVEYLYFVSKNDGSHYFSKTLREHNQAVRTYQKRNQHKPKQ